MSGFPHGGIAITTRQVLRDGWPILLVTHDADDGAWQFVNGHGDTEDTASAMVVGVEACRAWIHDRRGRRPAVGMASVASVSERPVAASPAMSMNLYVWSAPVVTDADGQPGS